MSVWMDGEARNQFLGMKVPPVTCRLLLLLYAHFQMQVPHLVPCIQACVDENEMVGPHPVLFHSERVCFSSKYITLVPNKMQSIPWLSHLNFQQWPMCRDTINVTDDDDDDELYSCVDVTRTWVLHFPMEARNQMKRITLTYAINLCIVVWQRIWSENKKRTKNYIKPFLYFICNSEVATAVICFAAVFTPKVCDNMMPLPTQLKFFWFLVQSFSPLFAFTHFSQM